MPIVMAVVAVNSADLGVEHVCLRVPVENDDQQCHTTQPGGIGLPLEPVQAGWKFPRCNRKFLQVVETTAMHCPQVTGRAFLLVLSLQVVFQPVEIEGCTYPGDTDDEVSPAS